MNCWWACSKVLLDYRHGEKRRREIMSGSKAAKKIYDANDGIKWSNVDGLLAQKNFGLKSITLDNQNSAGFSTEDILKA